MNTTRKTMSAHQTWAEVTPHQREAMLRFAGVPEEWTEILATQAWEELRPMTQEMLRSKWDGPVTER